MPLRRFRYDAKNDILKCPRGRILRPARPIKHGRFFTRRRRIAPAVRSRAIAYPKGGLTRQLLSVTIILHCSARAAVPSYGVSRIDGSISASLALRGLPRRSQDLARTRARHTAWLPNIKIQAYLTAAAINLKRLAAALLALILPCIVPYSAFAASDRAVTRGP